jgi:hypothetical protein
LQILRLPVLHHRLTEVRRTQVAPEADRFAVVGELFLVVEVVPGDRLAEQRRQEDREEEE